MRKILLLTQSAPDKYEVVRLQEEAKKLDIQLDYSMFSEIKSTFDNEHGVHVFIKDKDIVEYYDIFIFRNSKSNFGYYYGHYSGLIKFLANQKGKRILNYNTTSKYDNWATKLFNYAVLANSQVPVIKTYNFATLESLLKDQDKLVFPLIGKRSRGSHGEGVKILNSFEEIYDYVLVNQPAEVLFQEFIDSSSENKEDIRIVTLGSEVIGAYKKVAKKGSIVTNLAAGGDSVLIELTSDLIEIGQKVIKAMDAEFTGIDVIYDKNGKALVLEVNRAPEFEGFEKITGINLANKILTYLLNSPN